MKSYRIGSSGGLRFVFAVYEDVKAILPITVWLKKEMTNEADVLVHLKTRLKQSLQPGTVPEPPASV